MFTVTGSGFGLYGYLPALVETYGEPVLLPRAYESKVRARPELRQYLASIRWAEDAESALAMASGVVVANIPRVQPEIVSRCLGYAGIGRLVLEKPLAVTPAAASEMIDGLRSSGKRFRVGYTLLHTAWGRSLDWPDRGDAGDRVAITWTFMAHHFANVLANWKREHAQGGGVLRFFGVHLLALLARHGYRDVDGSVLAGQSAGEPERWRAAFAGPAVPRCDVEIDSRCEANRFRVTRSSRGETVALIDLQEPFELESTGAGMADRRVAVLMRLLDSFQRDDAACYAHYDEANRLWAAVEAASRFEVCESRAHGH
jgi:predicted dehydrogenase